MTIQQVSERELTSQGIRCVAVASLEWNGLKFGWLTSYAAAMQNQAEARCQSVCASGRAALTITHDNGNVTVWQGPLGSAESPAVPQASPAPAAVAAVAAAPPIATPPVAAPPAPVPQPQTITIKYRGRTIVKQVGPVANQQQKGQRSYRGQKY